MLISKLCADVRRFTDSDLVIYPSYVRAYIEIVTKRLACDMVDTERAELMQLLAELELLIQPRAAMTQKTRLKLAP